MINIYIDIETLPTDNEKIRERIAATIKAPGNYKKPESIKQWMDENFQTEFQAAVQKTALDGTWGKIVCIGWAVDDGPVNVTIGDGEFEVLTRWADGLAIEIDRIHGKSSEDYGRPWWTRAQWIGHNIQDFDIRFLWQRLRIHRLQLNFPLPMERYPKGPYIYDTMKEWSGYGKYVKQTDLELAFGIERNDPLASGADVATASLADIVAHCEEDVRCLRLIHKVMQ